MKTDKNTVIGFVLLAGLFFTYFWYTNKQQTEAQAYKQRYDDSVKNDCGKSSGFKKSN
jgi:YidC/Oxa1 family membrane protein insertase